MHSELNFDPSCCPLSQRSSWSRRQILLTGYFVSQSGFLISWKMKKQHIVSQPSAKVKYRSMVVTLCELKWLRQLFLDLHVSVRGPILLHCDSQSALHPTANPVLHECTKRIEIDYHLVRDAFQSGFSSPQYIYSKLQPASILTKALHPLIDCVSLGNYFISLSFRV